MKNYTKFTAIFLVLAVVLAFPVFAADGWHTFQITSDDWRTTAYYDYGFEPGDYFPQEGTLQANTNRLQYYFADNYDGIQGAENLGFLFEANFRLNVSAGDVLTIDAFTLNWFIGGANNYVEEIHLYAGKAITTPNNDGVFRLNIMTTQSAYATGYTSGQAVQYLNIPQTELHVLSDGVIDTLWLGFRIYHPDKGSFNVLRVPLTIHYGNPNSPEAPGYEKPNGDEMDDYHDLEQDVLDDTKPGMDIADGMFSGFLGNISGFVAGLLFVSELMGLFIVKVPVVGFIIQISLTLGLFAVLVGLSGSIIGAKERHDRNEKSRNFDSRRKR